MIPADRQKVVDAAREVEAAVYSLERLIEGAQAPLRGTVRVTSTDTLCHGLLPKMLSGLAQKASDLRFELICSNTHLDLGRLDADLAVKPAIDLQDGLVGSMGAKLGFAVYGDRNLPWLGMRGAIARSKPAQWLIEKVREKDFVSKADSFLTLREMVAAGVGKSILPCVLGDADPRLNKIENGMPDMSVGIWVACHPDMADVPRIRAVRNLLLDELAKRSDEFLGVSLLHNSEPTYPTLPDAKRPKIS
ncbi:LysR family transcriptional regulator [uncultured Tateyamaria sp.]|uniref:LysR family transcriptional regulator n=1 Tax=Tateyamaria sp. 1078 TaxID=3417464 RepID=UPI0026056405|nr:LysR family transcriptional regulator [uncultured Tateyamaria sp.]